MAAGFLLSAALAAPVQAQTARAEAVSRAVLLVEKGCLVTGPQTKAQRDAAPTRGLGLIAATLFAGVAGDLATSGLNAIGSALESASQEKGFVAEGVSSFNFYVVKDTLSTPRTWGIAPDLVVEPDDPLTITDATELPARCLILLRDGDPKSAAALDAQTLKNAFPDLGDERAAGLLKRLQTVGLTRVPSLYVEAELQSALDGVIVQPVLLRYGQRLPGAPDKETPAELVVSFATPGGTDATDIGTLFALSRVPLPKVTPGGKPSAKVWRRDELAAYGGMVVPLRPTTGSADDTLRTRNALETAIDAKSKEEAQLAEALRLAKRKLDQNAKPADRQELENAYEDAGKAVEQAQQDIEALRQKQANWGTVPAGSTNVKVRFVAIRDANGFGLALAKALKGQSDALGKAVTKELTPAEKKPAWTGDDTSYVEAQADVRAAQRTLDEAIAKGETEKVPGLQDAVLKAQAHANQAAVAAGRPLPYAITP